MSNRQVNRLSKLKFIIVKDCKSISSRIGQLKYCNSYKLRLYINKKLDINKIKHIISDNDKIDSGKELNSKFVLIR